MNLVTLWFGTSLFLGWGWQTGPIPDSHYPTMADCEAARAQRQAVTALGGKDGWMRQMKYVCVPAWEKP